MISSLDAEVVAPLPADRPDTLQPVEVTADMDAGEAAFAVLRAQHQAIHELEPLVYKGEHAEDLHKMRVATRRLRAAFAVFEPALPARGTHLRAQFGWLGSMLGAVRDLDVHLAHIEGWLPGVDQDQTAALQTLSVILARRREAARVRLLAGLDSQRFERLGSSFERFLAHGPNKRSQPARARILDIAPEAIEGAYRRVVTIGDRFSAEMPDHELHKLRIKAKRLRYTVEFLEPIYGKPARAYIKRVTALQDLLGEHQDAIVAIEMLRDIATKERGIAKRTVLAIGGLTERYRAEAQQRREGFPKRYDAVTGARWRKLLQLLEEMRDKPPEPEHGPMFGELH